MNATELEASLRTVLLARIKAGQLTRTQLALEAGFEQGSMSNFLNGKRALSLEGMNRILRTQRLSIVDLVGSYAKGKRVLADNEYEEIPLVESVVVANEPVITSRHIKGLFKFKKAFLGRLKTESENRSAWQRFVLMKLDAHEAMSMYPRLLPGASVLIDRHYTSLESYRKQERNLYAIRRETGCTVKYVEQAGQKLMLRPHNESYPLEMVNIQGSRTAADYIAGRVCHIAVEA